MPNAALPNVFMATAVDLGEPSTPAGGPHVRDKQDVRRPWGNRSDMRSS